METVFTSIFCLFFFLDLNRHIAGTVRAFDLIPTLRAWPKSSSEQAPGSEFQSRDESE